MDTVDYDGVAMQAVVVAYPHDSSHWEHVSVHDSQGKK